MSLYKSSLDFLLPESILAKAELDKFALDLELIGTPANQQFPCARVVVNGQTVWEATINGSEKFAYTDQIDPNISVVDLRIQYLNKQSEHTVVDDRGNIVENQSLCISKMSLNDVDVIATNNIYQLGKYYMNLTPDKEKYFLDHGFSIEPNHSLEMFENGEWKFSIQMPVLSTLASLTSFYQKHEVWIESQEEIYQTVYQKFLNIRRLQRQIKELKCNSNSVQ